MWARLIVTTVLAFAGSAVIGALAVFFYGTQAADHRTLQAGLVAVGPAAVVSAVGFVHASLGAEPKSGLNLTLRNLVAIPFFLVVAMRLTEFVAGRPAWAANWDAASDHAMLVGCVATTITQWRIFLWDARRRPVVRDVPAARFGRQPK